MTKMFATYIASAALADLRVLFTKKECLKLLRKLGLNSHVNLLNLAFALHPEDKALMGKAG